MSKKMIEIDATAFIKRVKNKKRHSTKMCIVEIARLNEVTVGAVNKWLSNGRMPEAAYNKVNAWLDGLVRIKAQRISKSKPETKTTALVNQSIFDIKLDDASELLCTDPDTTAPAEDAPEKEISGLTYIGVLAEKTGETIKYINCLSELLDAFRRNGLDELEAAVVANGAIKIYKEG